jgi:hypothetical protein
VVEAMSAGVIPVVLNAGGTKEIVDASCGFRAEDSLDYLNLTTTIFKLPPPRLQEYRRNAVNQAKYFSVERFLKDGWTAVDRGLLGRQFDKIVPLLPNDPKVLKVDNNPQHHQEYKYAAVIAEPRLNSGLDYISKNMLTVLGKEWKLVIFHSEANEPFVRKCFLDASPARVEFHKFEQRESPFQTYNNLLYSEDFWLPLIKYSRILIFQTDAFLIRKFPAHFLDYDYVGAPWCESNTDLKRVLSSSLFNNRFNDFEKYLVGNGGLSLRNPTAALECIRDLHGRLPLLPKIVVSTEERTLYDKRE